MRPSAWLAALAWVFFTGAVIVQALNGLTLQVVDADACAALFMAWAVYVRIGESR